MQGAESEGVAGPLKLITHGSGVLQLQVWPPTDLVTAMHDLVDNFHMIT